MSDTDDFQRVSEAKPRPWISDALALSSLTGVAYCVTYAGKLGASRFYGIPEELVTVEPTQVVAVAFSFIIIFGFLIGWLLIQAQPRNFKLAARWTTRISVLLIAVLILMASLLYVDHALTSPATLRLILGIVLFFLLIFISDGILKRKARGREERVSVVLAFYAICLALVGVAISFAVSFHNADRTRWYRIISEGRYKTYAIVWTVSNDLVIAQRYDASHHRLVNPVVLLKADKDAPIAWSTVKTGPLENDNSSWRQH